MGNWRTVSIKGSMDVNEAAKMIKELRSDETWMLPAACFHIHQSVCGLGVWINENGSIDRVGNLAERDFNLEDIEYGLVYLAANYPSLQITLHAGDDYEDLTCVASFVVKDGSVTRVPPQIEKLPPIETKWKWLHG